MVKNYGGYDIDEVLATIEQYDNGPASSEDKVEPCEVVDLFKPDHYRLHIFGAERLTILSESVELPTITNNPAVAPFHVGEYKEHGDSLEIGQLVVHFKFEENLKSFIRLSEWIRRSVPFDNPEELDDKKTIGVIPLYDNSNRLIMTYVFEHIFPTTITPAPLEAVQTSPTPATGSVTFEVNNYYIDLITDKN